jgi:hypothetical protein
MIHSDKPMLAALLVSLSAAMLHAQSSPAARPATGSIARRSTEIKRIARDLTIDDFMEISPKASNSRLAQIRRIVQEQVLETLNSGGKQEDVRDAVEALLTGLTNDEWKTGFAHAADLKGLNTMVVGYSLNSTGVLGAAVEVLGYRKGLTYELAAEIHEGGYQLMIDPVPSPRSNEVWYLDHGRIRNGGNYAEPFRLFSFDGYEFKTLWKGGGYFPKIIISKDQITIRYNASGGGGPRKLDTVLLTTSGVIASTSDEPQQ